MGDGREFGPFPIPVVGRIESDFQWSPDSIFLFEGMTTRERPEHVRIWTKDGAEFELIDVMSKPDFATVEFGEIAEKTNDDRAHERTLNVFPSGTQIEGVSAGGSIWLRIRTKTHTDPVILPIQVNCQALRHGKPRLSTQIGHH
jgi:hypothetical protein